MSFAGDLHEEDLGIFLGMASQFNDQEEKNRKKDIEGAQSDLSLSDRERHEYVMHIEDIYDRIGSAVDIAHSMAIVALHSRIEVARNKILQRTFPDLVAYEMHKIKYLKKHVYPSLPSARETLEVQELRLTANAIKHRDGKVSPKLGNISGLVIDSHLVNLDKTYKRLLPGVKSYMDGLVKGAVVELGN